MLRGEEVRRRRKEKGLSMTEVSATSGISMSRLGDYELGKRHNLELYSLLRLCAVLGCTVDEIIDYDYFRDGE